MPAVFRNPALGLTAGNVPIAAAGARLADSGTTQAQLAAAVAATPANLNPLRNSVSATPSLWFRGTAPATLNVAGPGAGDFTYSLKVSTTQTTKPILSGTPSSVLAIYVSSTGKAEVRNDGVSILLTGTVTINDGELHDLTVTRTLGVLKLYVDGAFDISTANATNFSTANTLLGKDYSGSVYLVGFVRLVTIENRALSLAEIGSLLKNGSIPANDICSAGTTTIPATFATGWTINAGAPTLAATATLPASSSIRVSGFSAIGGRNYRFTVTVNSLSAGSLEYYNGISWVQFATGTGTFTVDFVGVEGVVFGFQCTGGTAVLASPSLFPVGGIIVPDWSGYSGGPQVRDVSGNGNTINLDSDGVTGGVLTTIPGATPSPMVYLRTSSGYLIADQLVIPPNCSVQIWAKGNGTFSLGDSAGTPASVVNVQTAPTNLQPITQAGYVTANRKLYLTLGTATSVTVRVEYKSTP